MKSARNVTCAALFALSILGAVNQQKLKPADVRKLAVAAMPARDVKSPDVTIELDGERSQCAVYDATGIAQVRYPTRPSPRWTLLGLSRQAIQQGNR
jgi:hypothetical protein